MDATNKGEEMQQFVCEVTDFALVAFPEVLSEGLELLVGGFTDFKLRRTS